MSRNYDNWERLVAAVIKKQQLWELFHAHSRSPSDLSDASDFSSSSSFNDVSAGNWIPYNPQQKMSRNFHSPSGSTSVLSADFSSTIIHESRISGLVFVSKFQPLFEVEDLLRISPEIPGNGKFGVCYAAKLKNGITVVVKRLKMFDILEQDFMTYMGIVADVKHENVAELRAYYYTNYERLMIYDHYSGGSVSALLHGEPGENPANVDWNVRLRIAVGAARGISHIHKQNGGKLVHGNIKTSNIFLNSQGYGVVSDLGVSSMIQTTFPQSSRYNAPEVKSTRDVSQASDVYSFGILLLELLTRKPPAPALGHKAVNLVKLVNSASRKKWNTKVFDESLLLDPSMRDQIVRMLETGITCVANSPTKRPKISAVVKMIEDISIVSTGIEVSKLHNEDLLFASDKVLGYKKFGTSYKAILEDGSFNSVKRLKDVIVTNEEFQRHEEVVGRKRHKNVAELRSYYYSGDEELLVYNYFSEGSLSARLYGKKLLGWTTRLNIAVGAAKGIAHIHKKNVHKLVHGNISFSSILLNGWQYGIVFDVGSEKSFTDNREVSQASDVHCFGVVLLELLFAKPRKMLFEEEFFSLVIFIDGFVMDGLGSVLFDAEVWSPGEMDTKMLKILKIAVQCVAHPPERRPKMTDVVKMLEKI